MMRPSTLVITTSGRSNPIPLDRYVNGYAVAVTMKTAGAIYTLQYSLDDPTYNAVQSSIQGSPVRYSNSYNVSGVWFNWDDVTLVNASTNKSTNLAYPPAAIRINVTTKVSAGNPVTLTFMPMGMDAN